MEQLDIFGRTKEEKAIEFIRQHEPPEGYFLGFSGGKDSVVLYDLTVKAGVKFQAYYSATGIDPPELVKFIRDNYPDVKWKRPKRSFFAQIQRYGFPTKFARWCCDFLKKDPCSVTKVPMRHRLMGIRAEESVKRAKRANPNYIKKYGYWMYKPLFDWLGWEIWDYIEANNLKYCSLYDEGFSRIGCVVCPFLTYKQHQIHRQRWPKHYHAFEKAMKKLWDRKEKYRQREKGYASTFDEFLENWYRGNK